jgi:DNA-binding CsgD family transcriptional regulator/PAS domain-containing protein
VPKDTLEGLLAALYAAPLRPESWPVFLGQLGELCAVNKAALICHNFQQGEHRVIAALGDSVKDSEVARDYQESYYRFDEWTNCCSTSVSGAVLLGEQLWPRDRMTRSIFYNEFLKPLDVCRLAAVSIFVPPGNFDGVSLFRGHSEDEFSEECLGIFRQIVPHLKTALFTRRRLLELESRVSDLESALDALSTALIIVDAAHRIIFANRRAQRLLAANDGLVGFRGRLTTTSASNPATLRAALDKAVSVASGHGALQPQAIAVSRSNKRALQVVAVPCRSDAIERPRGAAAFVFVSDPDLKPVVRSEILQALFRLTPAEIRLATALLQGLSLSEFGAQNRVSKETVRSQLKAALSKTGTRRQSELITLLSKLPAEQL